MLLDDEVGGDDAHTAGDLNLHLGEHATALGVCALSCGNLMVDYQGLELGVVDGRLPAALAGLFGKSFFDVGLNSVRLGCSLDLVEQRELLRDYLLGRRAEAVLGGELYLLDHGVDGGARLSELHLERGDGFRRLGGEIGHVGCELGVFFGKRVVLRGQRPHLAMSAATWSSADARMSWALSMRILSYR